LPTGKLLRKTPDIQPLLLHFLLRDVAPRPLHECTNFAAVDCYAPAANTTLREIDGTYTLYTRIDALPLVFYLMGRKLAAFTSVFKQLPY
jgi:hypothetical protein